MKLKPRLKQNKHDFAHLSAFRDLLCAPVTAERFRIEPKEVEQSKGKREFSLRSAQKIEMRLKLEDKGEVLFAPAAHTTE